MALLRLLMSLRPWMDNPQEAAGLRRALDSEEGRAALSIPGTGGPARVDPEAWGELTDWIARLAALLDADVLGARQRADARVARWQAAARDCDWRFPDFLERLDV
jgi:hypothetical protein